jgi:hypothetical protein
VVVAVVFVAPAAVVRPSIALARLLLLLLLLLLLGIGNGLAAHGGVHRIHAKVSVLRGGR